MQWKRGEKLLLPYLSNELWSRNIAGQWSLGRNMADGTRYVEMKSCSYLKRYLLVKMRTYTFKYVPVAVVYFVVQGGMPFEGVSVQAHSAESPLHRPR